MKRAKAPYRKSLHRNRLLAEQVVTAMRQKLERFFARLQAQQSGVTWGCAGTQFHSYELSAITAQPRKNTV